MSLKDIIKQYGSNKDEKTMWQIVDCLCCYLDDKLSEDQKNEIAKIVYSHLNDGHFNKEFAEQQTAKMYRLDNGRKVYGPFISSLDTDKYYSEISDKIRPYNNWDWYVTVNMIYSDNYNLLNSWFENLSDEDLQNKVYQLAQNWLDDEDNPYGSSKIWKYFNDILN